MKKKIRPGSTISTSGVNLMTSMDEAAASCPTQAVDPMAIYERPGYKLYSFVDRFIKTDEGFVPVIKSKLEKNDLVSTFFVRCGVNRYQYMVTPGLYGIGKPDKNSEVLVTANFKLTFDHLRKALDKINAWILVLDTKGINVWCAAGKGTFSTNEIVKRVKECFLEKIVDHKRIIVPQLGATGVSARDVKKQSGFRVVYGPVRANDIPDFLINNRKADKQMRTATFTIYERFILTPVEIQAVLKPAFITALVLLVMAGIGPGIFSFSNMWERGMLSILALAAGIFSGAFITPVLLPFIPSREFAFKGIIVGSIFSFLFLMAASSFIDGITGFLALFLFLVAISSFLAMNFTGATPFTSPSGVEKEMKRYIPVQLGALVISSGLWIYSAF
jgi:hypothetical protein